MLHPGQGYSCDLHHLRVERPHSLSQFMAFFKLFHFSFQDSHPPVEVVMLLSIHVYLSLAFNQDVIE
jgi:hypothetical protein